MERGLGNLSSVSCGSRGGAVCLFGIPRQEVKVKSWLGAFPEADCILPFPEGGLSTETVATQVSPWLFVPFSPLTSLGKIGLGNRYINAVWSWYERKFTREQQQCLKCRRPGLWL